MLLHYKNYKNKKFSLNTFNTDLNIYMQNFTIIEGNLMDNYAVILLSSDLNHIYYNNIIFSNNLDKCENILTEWLNQKYDQDSVSKKYFYGNIIDVKNNKELKFGDSLHLHILQKFTNSL